MADTQTLLIIGATLFVAGFAKGVIGFGLPTIALSVLAATLGLTNAIALILFPSFATNLWQAVSGGAFSALIARLWPYLIAICLGAWFGVGILAASDKSLLTGLLGILLIGYALSNLTRARNWQLGKSEPIMSPLIGLLNGVITGMTGTFVVPGVVYLQALNLSRTELIQAMGMLFTVSTLALGLSLGSYSLLDAKIAGLSALAVIPAVIGMAFGARTREHLSQNLFRRLFFGALFFLGCILVLRAGLALWA